MYTLIFLLISIAPEIVSGYPSGAPPKSCASMSPEHVDVTRQTVTSPYTLTATLDKKLKEVRVSVGGDKVSGFLIQGRLSKDGRAVGKFAENSAAKYQDCSPLMFDLHSSVTHKDAKDKENLVFIWKPPKGMNNTGNITFYATLARSKIVYWLRQESNSLSLSAFEDDEPVIETTASSEVMTQKTNEMSTAKKTIVPTKSTTKKAIVSTKKVTSTTDNVMRASPTSQASATSVGISLFSLLLMVMVKVSMF